MKRWLRSPGWMLFGFHQPSFRPWVDRAFGWVAAGANGMEQHEFPSNVRWGYVISSQIFVRLQISKTWLFFSMVRLFFSHNLLSRPKIDGWLAFCAVKLLYNGFFWGLRVEWDEVVDRWKKSSFGWSKGSGDKWGCKGATGKKTPLTFH